MRASAKLWEASHRQRPLKVMIAVITPPFTPAHTESLPSTLIQSEKQFHCWKLKTNFAFLVIHWIRCLLKCLQDRLFTFPVHQFKLNYCILLVCPSIYSHLQEPIIVKVVLGLKEEVPLKEAKMSFCQR